MCGICGFLGDPSGINHAAMLQSIMHRGPDDEGMYEETTPNGVLWFGHHRLAIQDLSRAGHQPMSTHDGCLTITYNGEIYNFHELRKRLEQRGHHFHSATDTEVILSAWEAWGPDAVNYFRGMFAFALWDRKDCSLWLVRDRLGEKPLYYIRQAERILFASEVRCLLASGVVERRIDSDGLDSYLTFGSVGDPYTLVKDVRAVEAGHWALFRGGQWTMQKYWSLSDIKEATSDVPQKEAVETTAALLREANRLCMVSDVPVAVLLSGGIDSSSNVVMLNEMGFRTLETFSVVFAGPDIHYSEERWSSLVAERFGTRHHEIVVGSEEAMKWVPDAVQAMDQPSYDGVNTYLVCRAIRSSDIKVAISGQGADELFLGYQQRHLFPCLLKVAASPLKTLVRPWAALSSLAPNMADTKYEKILQLSTIDDAPAAAYLAQHSVFSHWGIERLRGQKRPCPSRFIRDQGGCSPLGRLSRLEIAHYLRNVLLRDGDQMSMAHSLELRQPFLDYFLVESVVSLPAALKVKPKRQKPLLVEAVGPALPSEVVQRRKQGFALPYNNWLRNGLSVDALASTDIGLDRKAVQAVYTRFIRGQDFPRYWALQVLSAWAGRERMSPP